MDSVAKKIFPEAFEQGKSQGHEQGHAEGLRQGRNALLLRLLRKRFGQNILEITIQERLRQATPEELDLWAERILDARSIQDVFGDSLSGQD